LWTQGPAPQEWIEYVLCTRLHKLPHEVRAAPYTDVQRLLICMEMEQQVERARQGSQWR
jgi:hypothetical protein